MKTKILFLMLTILSIIVSCQSNKKSSGLLGKWEIVNAVGTMAEINKGTVYNFEDETTLLMEKSGLKNKATYKINADTLKYSIGTITSTATFKVEGNTMTMQIVNSDQKFTFEKK